MSGTNTHCQGWWKAQLGKEPLASRASSPSLKNAFLRAQGALGWLRLPGSCRAVVEPASSPSIILISRRWQLGGPWQRGCTDSGPGPCGERQAGGIAVISHVANKNNNSPLWALQSTDLKFMHPQSPRGCWEVGGSPLGGRGQDTVPGPWFAHVELWIRQSIVWEVNGMQARSKAGCPALGWAQYDKSSISALGGVVPHRCGLSALTGSQSIP